MLFLIVFFKYLHKNKRGVIYENMSSRNREDPNEFLFRHFSAAQRYSLDA